MCLFWQTPMTAFPGGPFQLSSPFSTSCYGQWKTPKFTFPISPAAKGDPSLPNENQGDICCKDLRMFFPPLDKRREARKENHHIGSACTSFPTFDPCRVGEWFQERWQPSCNHEVTSLRIKKPSNNGLSSITSGGIAEPTLEVPWNLTPKINFFTVSVSCFQSLWLS